MAEHAISAWNVGKATENKAVRDGMRLAGAGDVESTTRRRSCR